MITYSTYSTAVESFFLSASANDSPCLAAKDVFFETGLFWALRVESGFLFATFATRVRPGRHRMAGGRPTRQRTINQVSIILIDMKSVCIA